MAGRKSTIYVDKKLSALRPSPLVLSLCTSVLRVQGHSHFSPRCQSARESCRFFYGGLERKSKDKKNISWLGKITAERLTGK